MATIERRGAPGGSLIEMRELILRLLPRGRSAQGVSALAAGTVAGQAIVVAAAPLLTRLYAPHDFGLLGVFAAVLGMVTVVSSLRLEHAIPIPRRDGAARQVFAVALVFVALVSGAVALLGLGWGQRGLAAIGSGAVVRFYWLLPLGIATGGVYQVLSMWAVRRRTYTVIALTRLQQGVSAVVVQIVFGVVNAGALGLLLGQLSGQASGLVRLGINAHRDWTRAQVKVTRRRLLWAVRRFRAFVQYDTSAVVFNTAGAQVPLVLFAMLLGERVGGFYLLAFRILSAPVTLVARSVSPVFLTKIIQARRQGVAGELFSRTLRTLAGFSLAPFLMFAVLAPSFFGIVFGQAWSAAGAIAAWTALWVGAQAIYSPLSVLLLGLERQRANLALQMFGLLLRMASIYLGYRLGGQALSIAFFSVTSLVYYAVALVVLARAAGHGAIETIRDLTAETVVATLIVAPSFAISHASRPLQATVAAVAMAVWMYRTAGTMRQLRAL